MKGKPTQPMHKWLEEIDLDQNLNQLTDLVLTPWNGLKRWFQSRTLQPVVYTAYYDEATGYPVLGQANPDVTLEAIQDVNLFNNPYIMKDLVTNNDTTSVQYKEWTVTTGKQWLVLFINIRNATDNMQPELIITPSGGSATTVGRYAANLSSGRVANMIGWDIYGYNAGGPLVLDSGDKIKISDITFTAADNMDFWIGYVEIDVA